MWHFFAWIVLTVLTAWGMINHSLEQNYQQQTVSFNILYRELSEKLAQHDAIISLMDANIGLEQLQENFQQIIGLQDIPVNVLIFPVISAEGDGKYWLNSTNNSIRLLIDLNILMKKLSLLSQFRSVQLDWNNRPLITHGPEKEQHFWNWEKKLTSRFQPFVLKASNNQQWSQLPWGYMTCLSFLWAVIICFIFLIQKNKRLRKISDLRAHFFEFTRLNTMDEVATGIVHELNQPLTAIMSYNQTALRLMKKQQYDKITSILDSSILQTQRIANLLTQYRQKLTTGNIVLQAVNILSILCRVEILLENEIKAGKVKVIKHIFDDLPMIFTEPLWVEQIFHNLISNAIQAQQDHTNHQNWICINITHADDMIKIVIADSGPGLSDEVLKNIFIPFFTTRQQGMGLGMTLTETLIQKLGGDIRAENCETGGARFIIWLPVNKGKEE
ncbi:sensor histidine kinase [Photorhabdus khanii]|uniref:histidine kinase n=1 Tax=Photorhabdus khanii subsp. guanajuatensis TaxID=2100166 RepID=A0A4R4JZQ5_9GAMM|nr:HAMP domain-containing sensor histidine kinase [Photorhabdus khanii]TDB60273.1 two-component sensor histidine kinase [Photorhabdus khanii subsp. guanajuatensis]